MKHVVPHDLDEATAKKCAEAALETYKAKFPEYNPTAEWRDDKCAEVKFKAKGITLKGELELTPEGIAMDLDVPLLFRPLKNRALKVIEEEIQEWIGKAKKGEL